MTPISDSALVQAFLQDHQLFMKLMREVGLALEEDRIDAARRLAGELNAAAGSHIAFEERVLYPHLQKESGDVSFVESLFEEHHNVLRAVESLISGQPLDPARLPELRAEMRSGLDHAEHCGTLISTLSQLPEADQKKMLDELLRLRSQGIQWTELAIRN